MAANSIVHLMKAAFSQIGVPYIWADENPAGPRGGPGEGFDCSGFTSWVLAREGIDVAHHAATQASQLPSVGQAGLKPGDLVFFSYGRLGSGVVDHVGIYIGGGKMIDAPHSGATVEVAPVDWSHFTGGGSVYGRLGNPTPPTPHDIEQIAHAANANVSISQTPGQAGAARAAGSKGLSTGELDGILRGLGLSPKLFDNIIHQAVVNQWSPTEFQANLYSSPEFENAFPGIFNNDGSLKMTPAEYMQLWHGEGGYADIAKSFGVHLDAERVGLLVAGDKSPTEFAFEAQIAQRAQQDDVYRQAFNQTLKAMGQPEMDKGGFFKLLAGFSDARTEQLYEASSLTAANVGISAKAGVQAAKQIGATPLTQVDVQQLVQQVRAAQNVIGPELRAAGITPADLAVLESGADPKGIATQLQQILTNRQAIISALPQRPNPAPGGGLFPQQTEVA